MSITSVNSNIPATGVVKAVNTQTDAAIVKAVNTQTDTAVKNDSGIGAIQSTDKNQPSVKELECVTEELNQFMESMNTNIGFALHTKTKTLMVQVEDNKTHKILKEFPAHELLDMVSRIRDCVGVFLDKKI